MSVTIVGYAILITDVSAGVKYFAIFLTVAGVSPCIALAIAFVGANFGPLYRRATVMGFFFTIGNSAGLISSNIYPSPEGPRFIKGHAINLGFAGLTFVTTSFLIYVNWRDNKRRDRISVAHPDGRDVDPQRLDSDAEKQRWGYEGLTRDELLLLGDRVSTDACFLVLAAAIAQKELTRLKIPSFFPSTMASVIYSSDFALLVFPLDKWKEASTLKEMLSLIGTRPHRQSDWHN